MLSVWENAKSRPTEQAPKGGIRGKTEKRPFFIPHIVVKIDVHVGITGELAIGPLPGHRLNLTVLEPSPCVHGQPGMRLKKPACEPVSGLSCVRLT